MKIEKNIKQLRIALNMTQDELAEKLYVTRQTVSNYETGKSRPDVEMLERIAQVLETDVNSLIYGPAPDTKKAEKTRPIAGTALTLLFGLLYALLYPITRKIAYTTFDTGWFLGVAVILRPAFFLFAGWTLMQMLGMALHRNPLQAEWTFWAGRIIAALLIFVFVLTLWYIAAEIVNHHLYINHIRGQWSEMVNQTNGTTEYAWSSLPAPVPGWVSRFVGWTHFLVAEKYPILYSLPGALLWFFGIPKRKEA